MDNKKTHNSGADSVARARPMGGNDKGHTNVGKEHGSLNSFVKKFNDAASKANPQGGAQKGK